jgi:hypothetical protein
MQIYCLLILYGNRNKTSDIKHWSEKNSQKLDLRIAGKHQMKSK